MLHERNQRTPQQHSKGVKNDHSPWSAPQDRRKRRTQAAALPLTSVDEYCSPPKRHNGGDTSPAARELALPQPCLDDALGAVPEVVPAAAAAAAAGPLAQGLFAPCAEGDAGFSPLASGLGAPSFAAGSCTAAAQHKQRRQLRQAAAWRLASSKQQAEAGRPRGSLDAGMGAAAAAAVSHGTLPCHPPPGSISSSLQWEPAAHMGHATQPFTFLAQPRQQQTHLKQRHEPCALAPPAPAAAPPVPHVPQQQQQLLGAPHHQQERPQAPLPQWSAGSYAPASRPPSQQVMSRLGPQWCSTGQDMETDLRQSWDSERSADVRPWQTLQARLREEASGPAAAALQQRQASMASEGDAAMRASGDGLPSARSSLDAPSCSVERQTSQLPLRSAMRGEPWHSHLPSPPGDDASPDPLLGRSTGSGRQRRRGSNSKWGCFSCASPFSCRGAPGGGGGSDDEGEVVRRNDSEEFVIRRKQSFPEPPGASPSGSGRGSAGRVKHTSLNRPPSGQDLVHRQDAFSARATPPGLPWSPCSEAGSDDSFSLASGPRPHSAVGLRAGSIEELAGSEGAPTPTVDALNDLLKALSLCPSAHPKDAEAMVAQACQDHSIQPNATTARTLEKMWAVHEQLYG